MFKKLIAAAALVLLAGCAQFVPLTTTRDAVDAQAGYLYGMPDATRFAGGRVALEFVELNTQETYVVRCRNDRRMIVFKVKPGLYRIGRMLIIERGTGGQMAGAGVLGGPPYSVPFEVKAGRAYYFGHYEAANVDGGYSLSVKEDSYAQNTQQLKAMYPELKDLPTERAHAEWPAPAAP